MIELRVLCDRENCKEPKELNLDDYVLNMDNALNLAGYESITINEKELWLCPKCYSELIGLQTEHTNKELEFVKA